MGGDVVVLALMPGSLAFAPRRQELGFFRFALIETLFFLL
jgi:hypothetical protein